MSNLIFILILYEGASTMRHAVFVTVLFNTIQSTYKNEFNNI